MSHLADESYQPAAGEALPAGTQIGDYIVEGPLGEGGMATVYVGTHPIIGKRVAIKVLRAALCSSLEVVERFIQEARAANEIGHPNIIDVYTFGTLPDGRCYFVMEWLKGRTLAEILDDDGPLPLPEAVRALCEICDALEAAHRAGIVHRDLKPQNVYFAQPEAGRPHVKLLDFGIAKLVGRPEGRTQQTQPGLTMGTPEYISPEQARGRAVDGAADVYSLGVLIFEMLTGQLPFLADNSADMIAMHLQAKPRAATSVQPALPGQIDGLIGRMMAKDAADRPSIPEVRTELEALLVAWPRRALLPMPKRGFALAGMVAALGLALVGFDRDSTVPLYPALLAGTMPPPPAGVLLLATPAPQGGELVIQPAPPWAEVRVDGAPLRVEDGAARLSFILSGKHAVEVSAAGHRTRTVEIVVNDGQYVALPVRLPQATRSAPRPTMKVANLPASEDFHTVDPWANHQ